MVFVVACFELHTNQLRFCVLQEKVVDLLRAEFLGGGCCTNVDGWGFIATSTQEGDAINEDAASMCAKDTFLDLSAVDACKWEQSSTYVVKDLDGVAVEGVDLVA